MVSGSDYSLEELKSMLGNSSKEFIAHYEKISCITDSISIYWTKPFSARSIWAISSWLLAAAWRAALQRTSMPKASCKLTPWIKCSQCLSSNYMYEFKSNVKISQLISFIYASIFDWYYYYDTIIWVFRVWKRLICIN